MSLADAIPFRTIEKAKLTEVQELLRDVSEMGPDIMVVLWKDGDSWQSAYTQNAEADPEVADLAEAALTFQREVQEFL